MSDQLYDEAQDEQVAAANPAFGSNPMARAMMRRSMRLRPAGGVGGGGNPGGFWGSYMSVKGMKDAGKQAAQQEQMLQQFDSDYKDALEQTGGDRRRAMLKVLEQNPGHFAALPDSFWKNIGSYMKMDEGPKPMSVSPGQMLVDPSTHQVVMDTRPPDANQIKVMDIPGSKGMKALTWIDAHGNRQIHQVTPNQAQKFTALPFTDGDNHPLILNNESGVVAPAGDIVAGQKPGSAGAKAKNWAADERSDYGALSDIIQRMPKLMSNVGATGGIWGTPKNILAKRFGLGGQEANTYAENFDAVQAAVNTMGASKRLKAAYQNAQELLPQPGHSEQYNARDSIPQLNILARRHMANMLTELNAQGKTTPDDVSQFAKRYNATPEYMDKFDSAMKNLDGGNASPEDVDLLLGEKMLPYSSKLSLLRSAKNLNMVPDNVWSQWTQQYPELGSGTPANAPVPGQ